jgi:hypothetical protein
MRKRVTSTSGCCSRNRVKTPVKKRDAATETTDHESSPFSFRGFLGLFSRLLSGDKHSAPPDEEGPTGFGKFHPARISRKQLEPESIFQIADLLA